MPGPDYFYLNHLQALSGTQRRFQNPKTLVFGVYDSGVYILQKTGDEWQANHVAFKKYHVVTQCPARK